MTIYNYKLFIIWALFLILDVGIYKTTLLPTSLPKQLLIKLKVEFEKITKHFNPWRENRKLYYFVFFKLKVFRKMVLLNVYENVLKKKIIKEMRECMYPAMVHGLKNVKYIYLHLTAYKLYHIIYMQYD